MFLSTVERWLSSQMPLLRPDAYRKQAAVEDAPSGGGRERVKKEEIGEAREIANYIFHLEGQPLYQALALKTLMHKGARPLSQEDVGKLLGWSQDKVSQVLGLLNLHPQAQRLAMDGKLGKAAAYKLARLDQKEQLKLLKNGEVSLQAIESYKREQFISKDVRELLDQRFTENQTAQGESITCPKCGHTWRQVN